jgi:hypothetical protein
MDTHSGSGERISYRAPEVRSLGTIAEITASGGGGFIPDGIGYSADHSGHPGGS